jgi:hypothetical protein
MMQAHRGISAPMSPSVSKVRSWPARRGNALLGRRPRPILPTSSSGGAFPSADNMQLKSIEFGVPPTQPRWLRFSGGKTRSIPLRPTPDESAFHRALPPDCVAEWGLPRSSHSDIGSVSNGTSGCAFALLLLWARHSYSFSETGRRGRPPVAAVLVCRLINECQVALHPWLNR